MASTHMFEIFFELNIGTFSFRYTVLGKVVHEEEFLQRGLIHRGLEPVQVHIDQPLKL